MGKSIGIPLLFYISYNIEVALCNLCSSWSEMVTHVHQIPLFPLTEGTFIAWILRENILDGKVNFSLKVTEAYL